MLVLFAIKVYPILLNENIGFVTSDKNEYRD